MNILKVDSIWTTKNGSNQTLTKDDRGLKKIALNICISIDFNGFTPVSHYIDIKILT